jgi:hypothetical protein
MDNNELKLKVAELAVKMVQQVETKCTKQVLSETEKNYKRIIKLIDGK